MTSANESARIDVCVTDDDGRTLSVVIDSGSVFIEGPRGVVPPGLLAELARTGDMDELLTNALTTAADVRAALALAPNTDERDVVDLALAVGQGHSHLLLAAGELSPWQWDVLLALAPAAVLDADRSESAGVLDAPTLGALADRLDCATALLHRPALPPRILRRVFETVTDHAAEVVRSTAASRGRDTFSSIGSAYRHQDTERRSAFEEDGEFDRADVEWRRALLRDPEPEVISGDDDDAWDERDLLAVDKLLPALGSLPPAVAEMWADWLAESDDPVLRALLAASAEAGAHVAALSRDPDVRVRRTLGANEHDFDA